ncbi:PilZ domain-containing protein [Qipengyuania sediminis]|uniref:PilZ domain-containing protein n=1 Tax=Qipengyuania sediminis TaxID=1532023 RepID=UPI001F101C13|nr:PilZ domain-containing protein [Qipengyuania sediminis]
MIADAERRAAGWDEGETMATAAADCANGFEAESPREMRAAPRFTSLIRAAKLISPEGEFVCVLRDVSSTGVRLRCFHPLPTGGGCTLELQNGETFALERVREDEGGVSFRFAQPVPVERLVHDTLAFPRRQLRLNVAIPLTLRTLAGPVAAMTENIAQQGCRLTSAVPLALAQPVIVEGRGIPAIRAKVRWRRGSSCGLVFDDTFSLSEFALAAARLQAPSLLAR